MRPVECLIGQTLDLGAFAIASKPLGNLFVLRVIDRRTLAILAPTNKAASVLRLRGVPATTIHRILYTPVYDPEYEKIAEWLAGNG
ncbi:MAG: ATPase, partial [Pseudomonadota bacterium]